MLALIQRVSEASVVVGGESIGQIDQGLLVFLGIEKNDTKREADKLLQRVLAYRVFADGEGRMNLSVSDVDGGLLIVSQFTLAAETHKGLRPGFSSARAPAEAQVLYEYFLAEAGAAHGKTASGSFGADMQVHLVNDGPVTFLLRSP